MATKRTVDVRGLRQQIEREHREIAAAMMGREFRSTLSSLAQYRDRRATELARWNHWPETIRAAIARNDEEG